jgi:hypothetical protein
MGAGDVYVFQRCSSRNNGLYRWILQPLRPHEYNGGLPPNESESPILENSNAVASFC